MWIYVNKKPTWSARNPCGIHVYSSNAHPLSSSECDSLCCSSWHSALSLWVWLCSLLERWIFKEFGGLLIKDECGWHVWHVLSMLSEHSVEVWLWHVAVVSGFKEVVFEVNSVDVQCLLAITSSCDLKIDTNRDLKTCVLPYRIYKIEITHRKKVYLNQLSGIFKFAINYSIIGLVLFV